jgi:hypothetical protein
MRHTGDDPRAQLLAPFGMLEPWFTSRGFHGCPFMNVSPDVRAGRGRAGRAAGGGDAGRRRPLTLRGAGAGSAHPRLIY